MDGTPAILSSPHPPTEVTIGESNSIPDSPLSSAPNSPERKPPSPMTPPPDLDDPALFFPAYNMTRQTKQHGRESRKSRLRAAQAARRPLEEKKTDTSETFEQQQLPQQQTSLRRISSLYLPTRSTTNIINNMVLDESSAGESIPMDEQYAEIVMGSRLSVTSDGVEVNRQRSDDKHLPAVEFFPSFDEEEEVALRIPQRSSIQHNTTVTTQQQQEPEQRSVDSQAPSIDEACTSPTALSEAGRRAALEREDRWDRFERGRSLERTSAGPMIPPQRRPSSSLSPGLETSLRERRDPTEPRSSVKTPDQPIRSVEPRSIKAAEARMEQSIRSVEQSIRTAEQAIRKKTPARREKEARSPLPARRTREDDRSSHQTGAGMIRTVAELKTVRRSEQQQHFGKSPKRPIDLTKYADKPLASSSDDLSSSDETPLVRNGISSFQDRQSLRQMEKQNQLRSMYGVARQQKVNPPTHSIEHALPPLLVDHNQLQTIGVKALMSVCDGIGSLFLTEKQITAKAGEHSTSGSSGKSQSKGASQKQKKRSTRRERPTKSRGSKQTTPPPSFNETPVEAGDEPMPLFERTKPATAQEEQTEDQTIPSFDPFLAETRVEEILMEDVNDDSDADVPPPPPLLEVQKDLDNSLIESESNSDDDEETETRYSASTKSMEEGRSEINSLREAESPLSTIAAPTGSISTSSTPDSHEIGPTVKAPSRLKGLDMSQGQEDKQCVQMNPTQQETVPIEDGHEFQEMHKRDPPLEQTGDVEEEAHDDEEPHLLESAGDADEEPHLLESAGDAEEKPHRRLDLHIARTEDDANASVSSRETLQSQRSGEWSLASAIKNQASRECLSYHSLSEHRRSDPDGNKESPFAEHSRNTSNTASLSNTEKEPSFDISEPPALRRLNGSIDSIVPEFSANDSTAKGGNEFPDEYSQTHTIPSDEGSGPRSTTLSPMSEFLAERIRDGRYRGEPPAGPSEDDFVASECPDDLKCPSYSSEEKCIGIASVEKQNDVHKTSIDSLDESSSQRLCDGLDFHGQLTSYEHVPSTGQRKQPLSRNNSENTNDLFNSLDQMVHDLQSMASGLYESGDSQSGTTVPSFDDALRAETDISSNETVEIEIRRDFLPPIEGFEGLPHLVSSINADPGIAKGDIMISLLNNDSCRVKDAVSRCRLMRQYSDVDWLEKKATRRHPGLTVLFDVDEDYEAGGINDVVQLEHAVSQCLKYDDFDRAFELCSDICQKYHEYEHSIKDDTGLLEKFQLYKATASYNLGIVHLLRGDIDEALTCHETAVLLRTGCNDASDSEYATLLNKSAACRIAAGDYVNAFTEMEEALLLAREDLISLDDYRQLAEILNNLGCLSYIGGKVDRAALYFNESLSVHEKVTSKSMYLGSRFSSHAAILNASITKANLGYLFLVTQKPADSIGRLEESLRDQEILLFGAHVTIISTMDHLIVANLLAGRKKQASEMLRRVYNILADAFGHDSEQCVATKRKIFALEMKDGAADVTEKNNRADESKTNEPIQNSTPVLAEEKTATAIGGRSRRTGRKQKRRHPYQKAEC